MGVFIGVQKFTKDQDKRRCSVLSSRKSWEGVGSETGKVNEPIKGMFPETIVLGKSGKLYKTHLKIISLPWKGGRQGIHFPSAFHLHYLSRIKKRLLGVGSLRLWRHTLDWSGHREHGWGTHWACYRAREKQSKGQEGEDRGKCALSLLSLSVCLCRVMWSSIN